MPTQFICHTIIHRRHAHVLYARSNTTWRQSSYLSVSFSNGVNSVLALILKAPSRREWGSSHHFGGHCSCFLTPALGGSSSSKMQHAVLRSKVQPYKLLTVGKVYNPFGRSDELPGGLRKVSCSESTGELGIYRNTKKR